MKWNSSFKTWYFHYRNWPAAGRYIITSVAQSWPETPRLNKPPHWKIVNDTLRVAIGLWPKHLRILPCTFNIQCHSLLPRRYWPAAGKYINTSVAHTHTDGLTSTRSSSEHCGLSVYEANCTQHLEPHALRHHHHPEGVPSPGQTMEVTTLQCTHLAHKFKLHTWYIYCTLTGR